MERLAARDVARRVEAHVVVAVPPRSCRGLYAREVKFELGFGIGFGFGFGFGFGLGRLYAREVGRARMVEERGPRLERAAVA